MTKLERRGVIHNALLVRNQPVMTAICETRGTLYPADELEAVDGARVTTCVACLGMPQAQGPGQ